MPQAIERFNYRYFERFTTDGLAAVRANLNAVLDDRARQSDLFADPVPETPRTNNAPAVAAPANNPDAAYQLSPSQLNTWLACPAKWMYRYLLGLPDTSNAARALGRAVHDALGANFGQKVETYEDLPTSGVEALFVDAFARELDGAVLDDSDDVEDLRDTGRAAVSLYMDQAAAAIEPAAVELHVSGAIAGVKVQGYIDILDTQGRVIDIKTARKKPSGIRPDYRLQVATYAMLEPRATGAKIDTLVKTKTLQLVEQTFAPTGADRRSAEVLYPLAQEEMRSGLYAPHRGSMLCSRKYCAYWERCVEDYGGEVPA